MGQKNITLILVAVSVFVFSAPLLSVLADAIAPEVTLNSFPSVTSDSTPSVTGLASDDDEEVEAVQFKVGSGSWSECSADDGAFDEDEENFTCTVASQLSDGEYEIFVRSRDNSSNVTPSGEEESVEFTVDTVAPAPPGILSPTSYCEDCVEPALIFRKASDGEEGSGVKNYSVYLDDGKRISYGTTGIPPAGHEEESEEEWKSDNYVTVTFYNEHDDAEWNDEIWVEFAGLEIQPLSAGKHTWRVTVNDLAGNESTSTTDFYIDETDPEFMEVAVADTAMVISTGEYKLRSTARTPSFSGKVTDFYVGTQNSTDVYDETASGPEIVTLSVQKLVNPNLLQKGADEEDDDEDTIAPSVNKQPSPYKHYSSSSVKFAKIDNDVNNSKSGRFFISVPYPLENGYYKVSMQAKDKSGNESEALIFYLSLNYKGPGAKTYKSK